jgi:hypothetical protein
MSGTPDPGGGDALVEVSNVGCLVWGVVILGALFLFSGDPDVFDALVLATRRWLLGSGCP